MSKYKPLTSKVYEAGPDEFRMNLKDFVWAEVYSPKYGKRWHCKGSASSKEIEFFVQVTERAVASAKEKLESILPPLIHGELVAFFTERHQVAQDKGIAPNYSIPDDFTIEVTSDHVQQYL